MGRPRITLTLDMCETAERMYAKGHVHKTVSDALGVGIATLKRWVAHGKEVFHEADLSGYDEACAFFWAAYVRGRNGIKTRMLTNIADAAEKDWRAGQYFLSTLDPESYSAAGIAAKADPKDPSVEDPLEPDAYRPELDIPPVVKP